MRSKQVVNLRIGRTDIAHRCWRTVLQYDRIRIFMRYEIVIDLIFYSQDVKSFGFGHYARQSKQKQCLLRYIALSRCTSWVSHHTKKHQSKDLFLFFFPFN